MEGHSHKLQCHPALYKYACLTTFEADIIAVTTANYATVPLSSSNILVHLWNNRQVLHYKVKHEHGLR